MILRNVEVDGRQGVDVRIDSGRIVEIGAGLAREGEELDGAGGALIPGLADHHIHLLALAAQAASVDLSTTRNAEGLRRRLEAAAAERAPGAWIRASGYDEGIAGELSREVLDRLAPNNPVRVLHRTGALWVLNSAGLAVLGETDLPEFVERDAVGRPTGRIWRGDAWLRGRIGANPPPLAPIGRQLAAYGITSLTDASVTTDGPAAALLADAVRAGDLPQRLMLMSGGRLAAPPDGAFRVGPVKILLDDHDLPPLDDMVERIRLARTWDRCVAAHCVTEAELALALAAFEAAGARTGDRIEHGGLIPQAAIRQLRALGLTVVTQPAFIAERGDRYIRDLPAAEHADLYRCASLLAAGTPTAASSDAPYVSADPWLGLASAVRRRTAAGQVLGAAERVGPSEALRLYLGEPEAPGGPPRRVAPGAPADLCLLRAPLDAVLAEPEAAHVRFTFVAGRIVFAS